MATKAEPDTTRRILIVENEIAVAMHIEDLLLENGYQVVGIAREVDAALRYVEEYELDGVLLDLDLGGTPTTEIAQQLREKGIPFVLETAHPADALLDTPFIGAALVQKPWKESELLRALHQVVEIIPSCGTAMPGAADFSFTDEYQLARAHTRSGVSVRLALMKNNPAPVLSCGLATRPAKASPPAPAGSDSNIAGSPGAGARNWNRHAIGRDTSDFVVHFQPFTARATTRETPGISRKRPDVGLHHT